MMPGTAEIPAAMGSVYIPETPMILEAMDGYVPKTLWTLETVGVSPADVHNSPTEGDSCSASAYTSCIQIDKECSRPHISRMHAISCKTEIP